MNKNFLTILRDSAKESGNIISFGIDPVIESLPREHIRHGITGMYYFLGDLFSEMKSRGIKPAMFKPNFAWWLDHDFPMKKKYAGQDALSDTINLIRRTFPGIPITRDSKDGDIGTSSAKWASVGYNKWEIDATTVHPYMGEDSVGPFINYCNNDKKKGAYILVRTTNKGASDFELQKMADGRMLYEHVAEKLISWAENRPGTGFVAAGNGLDELQTILRNFAGENICGLIPGVGSQGGSAKDVVTIAEKSGFEIPLLRVGSSSQITHSWYKKEGDLIPTLNECIEICIHQFLTLSEETKFCFIKN